MSSSGVSGLRLALPSKSYRLDDLTTDALQALANSYGLHNPGSCSRDCLLAYTEQTCRAQASTQWEVHTTLAACPGRAFAGAFSYKDELYVYGGLSANYDLKQPYHGKEPFMVKLEQNTHSWEPVSLRGAPKTCWNNRHSTARGVVHNDKFYLPSPHNDTRNTDAMRIYDFAKRRWTLLDLDERPPSGCRVFLGLYKDQLIQFGGETGFMRVWVDSACALWTFDTQLLTWQQRQSSGDIPEPAMCVGMEVVGSQAYVLTNHRDYTGAVSEPDHSQQMEMYVLDLETWHWTQLPSQSSAPPCVRHISPAVVQGHWLLFGGNPTDTEDGRVLYDFNFDTQIWSKAVMTGDRLQHRAYFSATCHQGALVVMGGHSHKAVVVDPYDDQQIAEGMQSIWPRSTPNVTLRRYGVGSSLMDLMRQGELTGITLTVESSFQTWQVHRLMLAACSPFLRQSLTWITGNTLMLPGVSADIMDILVDYMYGNCIDHVTLGQATALLTASHQYDIPELYEQCEQIMAEFVTVENHDSLADLAVHCTSDKLKQACKEYAVKVDTEGSLSSSGTSLTYSSAHSRTASSGSTPSSPSHSSSHKDAEHPPDGTIDSKMAVSVTHQQPSSSSRRCDEGQLDMYDAGELLQSMPTCYTHQADGSCMASHTAPQTESNTLDATAPAAVPVSSEVTSDDSPTAHSVAADQPSYSTGETDCQQDGEVTVGNSADSAYEGDVSDSDRSQTDSSSSSSAATSGDAHVSSAVTEENQAGAISADNNMGLGSAALQSISSPVHGGQLGVQRLSSGSAAPSAALQSHALSLESHPVSLESHPIALNCEDEDDWQPDAAGQSHTQELSQPSPASCSHQMEGQHEGGRSNETPKTGFGWGKRIALVAAATVLGKAIRAVAGPSH